MPFAHYLILSNFFMFLCFSFLVVFILTDKTFDKKTNYYFLLAIIIALLLSFFDSTRIYFSLRPEPGFAINLMTVLGYIARPLGMGLLLDLTVIDKKRNHVLIMIAVIINMIVCISNLFYPLIFAYTENNLFIRGPIGYFPHSICLIFALATIVSCTRFFHDNKRKVIFIYALLLLIAFASILEMYSLANLMISAAGSISVLFFYFHLNVDMYKRDSLTKLFNRRNFDLDCQSYIKKNMIILSMDLNDLKYFNDTYGHKAGDKAIITAVEGMKKFFGSTGILYRTGGDEFMGIFPKCSEEEVLQCIKNFQEYMKKTDYRVACGCAKFNRKDDLNEIIQLSDKRMYENKLILKSR